MLVFGPGFPNNHYSEFVAKNVKHFYEHLLQSSTFVPSSKLLVCPFFLLSNYVSSAGRYTFTDSHGNELIVDS